MTPAIIDDAQTLSSIAPNVYDFVVAAHIIEHLPNPILALENWCRVLRRGGLIYLVVPDPRITFDRTRPRTPLSHLVLDYREPSVARDYEHFLEYAVHVNRARPVDASDEADRLVRTGYSIHYHVFEPSGLLALVDWFTSHIRPLCVMQQPIRNVAADEFHLLLRVQ